MRSMSLSYPLFLPFHSKADCFDLSFHLPLLRRWSPSSSHPFHPPPSDTAGLRLRPLFRNPARFSAHRYPLKPEYSSLSLPARQFPKYPYTGRYMHHKKLHYCLSEYLSQLHFRLHSYPPSAEVLSPDTDRVLHFHLPQAVRLLKRFWNPPRLFPSHRQPLPDCYYPLLFSSLSRPYFSGSQNILPSPFRVRPLQDGSDKHYYDHRPMSLSL